MALRLASRPDMCAYKPAARAKLKSDASGGPTAFERVRRRKARRIHASRLGQARTGLANHAICARVSAVGPCVDPKVATAPTTPTMAELTDAARVWRAQLWADQLVHRPCLLPRSRYLLCPPTRPEWPTSGSIAVSRLAVHLSTSTVRRRKNSRSRDIGKQVRLPANKC